MKRPGILLWLFAGISLATCSKDGDPAPDHPEKVQLKVFGNDKTLRQALGRLVNGYDVTFSLYQKMDVSPYGRSPFYETLWLRPIREKPMLTQGLNISAGTTDSSIEGLLSDPNLTAVEDPRLGNSPYTNVRVVKLQLDAERTWVYELLIDRYDSQQHNQYVNLTAGFSYEEPEDAMYRPELPTDTEAVTALLNLVEPILE